ncbi:MAG: hypothetical protein HQK71_06720 [Desulfamplus sp.]|nr:hypothetical protein [Desulfamplus sp.]
MISQYHCQVEKFKRDSAKGDLWIYSSVEDMNASVKIDSINCELALSEIYYRVEF